jgi:hypothetical protein
MEEAMKRVLATVVVGLGLAGAPAIAQAQVIIQAAPPAPQYETVPVAPSPNHIWVHGNWQWNGGRYIWIAGHWDMPPQAGQIWIPAHYDRNGPGWMFVPGHWQAAGGWQANIAPPPPQAEVQPVAPGAGYAWVGGHWQWGGRQYFWVPGHWMMQQPGRMWVGPRWENRGGGWFFAPGHWQ